MKNLFFCCAFIWSSAITAQSLYTKDNIYLGEKADFMLECVGAAEEEMTNISGYSIETEKFCSCMCDNLLPNLTMAEIEELENEEDMMSMFQEEKNMQLILQCLDGNYSIEDDFQYNNENVDGATRTLMISACTTELLSDPEGAAIFTKEMAEEFCTCAIDELVAKGYTYEQINQAENEDSQAFNELVVPCMMKAMAGSPALEEETNIYNPNDVIGTLRSTRVPLTDYLKQGYKLKIDIGGVSKYFLLDTGASDILISTELEKELLKKGAITAKDYGGEKEYTLANGQTVKAQAVTLNNIVLGEYTINNVQAGIIEGGSLLCGNSLLGKFSHWEIDQKNMELILYK